MLFLVFRLGDDRYALPAQQVVEVVPLLQLKRWPKAAQGVAGVCTYRGRPVPVLDLSELILGRPAPPRLSTRLLLVRYPDSAQPGPAFSRLLALMAEQATNTVRLEPRDFVEAGLRKDDAPYLGPLATEAGGLLQRIEVEVLLPPALRDTLFAEAQAACEP